MHKWPTRTAVRDPSAASVKVPDLHSDVWATSHRMSGGRRATHRRVFFSLTVYQRRTMTQKSTMEFDLGHDKRKSSEMSESQLQQLADAREVALQNRRTKLLTKLETKCGDLRKLLAGCSQEQIERIASALLQQEARLRASQSELTNNIISQLADIKREIASLHSERHGTRAPPSVVGSNVSSSLSTVASSRRM